MGKNYLGALDQGTTSTRFIIFDTESNIISEDHIEHEQIYPKPGWVEHDPIEIIENSVRVIKNAVNKANIDVKDIKSIGITNQRETTLAWDKQTGKPLYNAIVWQDMRTEFAVNNIISENGKDCIRARSGLPIATYFAALRMSWILANVKEAAAEASKGNLCFGTIDSWLIYNITNNDGKKSFITDVTNASRTMLMNIKSLEWDEHLISFFKIPKDTLADIKPSVPEQPFGMLNKEILGIEIPIYAILGDQQAALFGQACFKKGVIKNTYGTGCFMLMHTGQDIIESKHGLRTTVAYKIKKEKCCYALEGSVAVAGALLQWLRDRIGFVETVPEIDRLAETVEDNGGVYIVPAFSGLFTPYWSNEARGVITGLTGYVSKAHIARSALESTALQVYDVLNAMQKDSNIPINEIKVDGGMVSSIPLMQFQADILGIPVVKPTIIETTALGAAYASGIGVGIYKNENDVVKNWKEDIKYKPQMIDSKRDDILRYWKKAIERSMDWLS